MTREEAKDYIREWCPYDRQEEIIKVLEKEPCIQEKQANADKIDAVYIDGFKAGYSQARFDLEQEPCEDAISRDAVLEKAVYTETEEGWSGYTVDVDYIKSLPSVKPQEPSITWVTGADGAKIAFWDVPVWKVTKICEILGDPQESEE